MAAVTKRCSVALNDENIERLFGAEDAENEDISRFKEYFFKNRAYENITNNLSIRILVGHKGVGKSALLKRAFLQEIDHHKLSIWIQPNDIASIRAEADKQTFNQRIENWKNGILQLLFEKSLSSLFGDNLRALEELKKAKRGGSILGPLLQVARELAPKQANAAEKLIVQNFLKEEVLTIYIDDVDRGWSATKDDIQNISALLNAIRDITGADKRIRCRIALRTDVYYLVRTSDESTDKIERNVVWLEWTNHEILSVIATRITTFFNIALSQDEILRMEQSQITSQILYQIAEPVYNGLGHWSNRPVHKVLLSLCRKRPRDLVKLLHASARQAHKNSRTHIATPDLSDSFQQYSEERLQDLINEFKSELPNIEKLLLQFKPPSKKKRTADSYTFKNDALLAKLNDIRSKTELRFASGKPVTSRSLLQFLYKIDFITARLEREDGFIERKYFDQSRFLANEVIDFGYDWEIHPAYRWALQPNDLQYVIDTIKADVTA